MAGGALRGLAFAQVLSELLKAITKVSGPYSESSGHVKAKLLAADWGPSEKTGQALGMPGFSDASVNPTGRDPRSTLSASGQAGVQEEKPSHDSRRRRCPEGLAPRVMARNL